MSGLFNVGSKSYLGLFFCYLGNRLSSDFIVNNGISTLHCKHWNFWRIANLNSRLFSNSLDSKTDLFIFPSIDRNPGGTFTSKQLSSKSKQLYLTSTKKNFEDNKKAGLFCGLSWKKILFRRIQLIQWRVVN